MRAQYAEDEAAAQTVTTEQLEAQRRITESYLSARENVKSILLGERTEYERIQDQIDYLNQYPWQPGALEDDRLRAIEILRGRQGELIDTINETKIAARETNEFQTASAREVEELEQIFHEQKMDRIEERKQARISEMMEYLNISQQVFGQISALSNSLFMNESIRIDNQYQKRRDAIMENVKDEEERARRIDDLEEKTAKKRRKLQRDEAIANKAFAAFDIAIKTSMGILGALAMLPPRPGLATFIGAVGAAQLAATLARPLPALADGGILPARPGGTAFIGGEGGQPEVVFPLDRLESFLSDRGISGGGRGDESPIQLTVMMDSKPILSKVFQATRNREVLIDARAVV